MGIVGTTTDVAKGILMSRNFPPLRTLLSAIIAFSLSLVTLLSSGEKGALNEYAILSV